MKKIIFKMLIVIVLVTLLIPTTVFAKGKPIIIPPPHDGEETAGNNLSFPVIAVDNFNVLMPTWYDIPGGFPSFDVPYVEDSIEGTWYAQKTDGNAWQAGNLSQPTNESLNVDWIDWSDSMESVAPKLNRPFRLEVVLFKVLTEPMLRYEMTVLANPSSPDEMQGTNTNSYDSYLATVVSGQPKLKVQYLGTAPAPNHIYWDSNPSNLEWYLEADNTADESDVDDYCFPVDPVSFAVELNVAGRYIYGASVQGWVPTQLGYYRITFYVPNGDVNLATAQVGNFDGISDFVLPDAEEGAAAVGYVSPENNLCYIDVHVVGGGGGKK